MQHTPSRSWPLHCALAAILLAATACQPTAAPVAATADSNAVAAELAAMKADIQMLKDKAPSASVAMADVSFHWSNLWFAGQAKNWPLAAYTTASRATTCGG